MSKNLPDDSLTNDNVHINVSVEKARFVCSTVLKAETVFGQRKVWKESDCGGKTDKKKCLLLLTFSYSAQSIFQHGHKVQHIWFRSVRS